jgi:16S rRNA (cytosine1402-N4)-methyltransferase
MNDASSLNPTIHVPIMVNEIVQMVPPGAAVYVDGTAWHGGHIAAIARSKIMAIQAHIIAIDRDAQMLTKAQMLLAQEGYNLTYVQNTYANMAEVLGGIKPWLQADFVLLDIGVNMEHFKNGDRGFSIHEDAPLDMRFDTRSWQTAADFLNTASTETIASMLVTYGDFAPKSWDHFAEKIITRRKLQPFTTTRDFVDFLYSVGVRKAQLPIFFQCIRIIVNDELGQLEKFLSQMDTIVAPGWRVAIITFHSIEDRIVKYNFKEKDASGERAFVNKKVIAPHYTEVQRNRASRSAKLRVIEKKK